MANAKVKTNKQSLASRITKLVLSSFALLLIVAASFSSFKQISTHFELKAEAKEIKIELRSLEEEQSNLALEKKKLSNPSYVENYARGTHLLSKNDEQVFILPKKGK